MLRALASLFFYTRFLRPFSRIGLRQRQRQWSELPRLDGQRWLVSGASGGIGAAIVRGAIERGASVIAVARSAEKLAALRADTGAPERFVAECCDLASVSAVRELLQRLAERGERIDVLVNNVGVLLNDFQQTGEGFESSFVSNLLNHYLLTEGLRAHGLFAAGAAVINMASGGMYGARLDLAKLDASSADYDGMAAYAQHKRAQVELTRYWNAQWQGEPKVFVMHPGWVDTDGVKQSLPWFRATLKRYLRDAAEGADTALWLGATRPPPPSEGIWLDRVPDPEHVFAISRGGASGEELARYLDAAGRRV